MSNRPRNRPRKLTSQRTPWEDKTALQKLIRPRISLHFATLPLRGPDLDFCIPSPRTPSGGEPSPARTRLSQREVRAGAPCHRSVKRAAADLSPEEAEILRRSIAMLPPQSPSGVSQERALGFLSQLGRVPRELRRR
jgi:hypothetical protein